MNTSKEPLVRWRSSNWTAGHDDSGSNPEWMTKVRRRYIQEDKKAWPRSMLSVYATHFPHMAAPEINFGFSTKNSLESWWQTSHDGVPVHLLNDLQEMIVELKEKLKEKNLLP